MNFEANEAIKPTPGRIKGWFETGKAIGAQRMVIMLDNFDGSFYAEFLHDGERVPEANPKTFQKPIWVLDLAQPFEAEFKRLWPHATLPA